MNTVNTNISAHHEVSVVVITVEGREVARLRSEDAIELANQLLDASGKAIEEE